MSRYVSLWKYVSEKGEDHLFLSFSEIEGIIGRKIDHSFLTNKKELSDYGYQVKKISMKDQMIEFVRNERNED